jgi:5-methylcytosine-specific restriction endonuclease McrA
MARRSRSPYPPDWPEIARAAKDAAGWRCVRCGRPHDPTSGYSLTVHHLDRDPSNCVWWNLLALCQRCHLSVQGRVRLERPWVFEHSAWFREYVAGWYAWRYLGVQLTRDEVRLNLGALLTLEARVVIGHDPIKL